MVVVVVVVGRRGAKSEILNSRMGTSPYCSDQPLRLLLLLLLLLRLLLWSLITLLHLLQCPVSPRRQPPQRHRMLDPLNQPQHRLSEVSYNDRPGVNIMDLLTPTLTVMAMGTSTDMSMGTVTPDLLPLHQVRHLSHLTFEVEDVDAEEEEVEPDPASDLGDRRPMALANPHHHHRHHNDQWRISNLMMLCFDLALDLRHTVLLIHQKLCRSNDPNRDQDLDYRVMAYDRHLRHSYPTISKHKDTNTLMATIIIMNTLMIMVKVMGINMDTGTDTDTDKNMYMDMGMDIAAILHHLQIGSPHPNGPPSSCSKDRNK